MRQILLYVLIAVQILTVSAQIPSGYYNAAVGKTEAALKTALYNKISAHTERSYTQLWTDFQTTDKRADGKVWDMYSIKPNGTANYYYTHGSSTCGSYSGEGSCYNREGDDLRSTRCYRG